MRVTSKTIAAYLPAVEREQKAFLEKKQAAREEQTGNNGTNTASSSVQSRKLWGAYETKTAKNSRDQGQAALKKALDELAKTNKGKITFEQVFEYRKKMEEEFSKKLREDLTQRGVGVDVDFKLSLTPQGNLSVQSKNAVAKERIEKYFAASPTGKERFEYIQHLASFEKAQKQAAADPMSAMRNTKKALQAETMEVFFSEAINAGLGFSSILADFPASSDTANFYTGLNYRV